MEVKTTGYVFNICNLFAAKNSTFFHYNLRDLKTLYQNSPKGLSGVIILFSSRANQFCLGQEGNSIGIASPNWRYSKALNRVTKTTEVNHSRRALLALQA